jgi:hypothetical protein
MSFWDRFRLAVQKWLGIDVLSTRGLIQAREKADRERHAELMTALGRIEQRMTVEHIDPSQKFDVPILDWDTVQAIALHDLEKEQEPQ